MMITSEKELGKAIKNNENYITIEGDLGKKIVKIKATGPVAWPVALGALTICVAAAIAMIAALPVPPAEGALAFVAVPTVAASLGTAGTILGMSAATSAFAIAVAGGGVAVLRKLRGYKLKQEDGKVILYK
jgi:hypothetical protein